MSAFSNSLIAVPFSIHFSQIPSGRDVSGPQSRRIKYNRHPGSLFIQNNNPRFSLIVASHCAEFSSTLSFRVAVGNISGVGKRLFHAHGDIATTKEITTKSKAAVICRSRGTRADKYML